MGVIGRLFARVTPSSLDGLSQAVSNSVLMQIVITAMKVCRKTNLAKNLNKLNTNTNNDLGNI